MESNNPYSPPASRVADPAENVSLDEIDALPVSDKWKIRFRAISKAGGVRLPNIKNLPKSERRGANGFNALAFFFGPFYYMAKGMWRRGITLFLVCLGVLLVVELILEYFGLSKFSKSLGYGVGAVFAVRANIDFYKKMVLKDYGWW